MSLFLTSRPFVALSHSHSHSLSLSLCSSSFFRDIGTHSTGFRQARMPLSALTVPLGSSPSESRIEDPWRARFQPRLPGSMRNAGSDEKEDWLETEFGSAGRRRYVGGKSRLTIRGSSLRPLCPLPVCLFLYLFPPFYLPVSRFSFAEFPMEELCAEFAAGISNAGLL